MKFPSDKLVTVKELAEYLDVTTAAVYKWVKDGVMPAPYRLGGDTKGCLRWSPEEVNAWLEQTR